MAMKVSYSYLPRQFANADEIWVEVKKAVLEGDFTLGKRVDKFEEEFAKFVADYKPEEAEAIPALKNYFKAYLADNRLRIIIETKQLTELHTNPSFGIADFKAIPLKYRTLIPEYIKDYVSLNQFAA